MTLVKVTNNRAGWRPVKKGNETGLNKVIVMQRLDDGHVGETVKLNLNSEQPNKNYVLSVCIEGWVLNVDLRTDHGILHVDKKGQFYVVKRAAGLEATDETGALPTQASLFDEPQEAN